MTGGNPVKLLMSLVIGSVTLLVLALLVIAGLGAATPRQHTASSTADYHQPADSLYATIADLERAPRWRSDLTGTRRLPDQGGHVVWEQQAKDGAWPIRILEATPPSRFVSAVADTSQGFGGTWTFVVEPLPNGARVTITEVGNIDNLLIRFLAHRFFDLRASQQIFLRDLGTRFGETVTPRAL